MITPWQAKRTKEAKIRLKISKTKNGCYSTNYPLFCDYVMQILRTNKAFGKTPAARLALLERGGLTIRTTMDPKAQRSAQRAIRNYVPPPTRWRPRSPWWNRAPARSRAGQSRPFGYNRTRSELGQLRRRSGRRRKPGFQTGSTMKAFTTAAALQEDPRHPFDLLPYRLPITKLDMERLQRPQGVPEWPDGDVTNFDTFENGVHATHRARDVGEHLFCAAHRQVGLCPSSDGQAGRRTPRRREQAERDVPFTLGTNEIAPLTMANAYATLAARGMHCDTYAILM
jgi:membrane peptidoglycan carboxypeptidase